MNGLLLLSWLLPLLLIPAMLSPTQGRRLLLLAPVPALLAVLLLPSGSTLSLTWLLLGTQLQLDPVRQLFLALTAILWLFAYLHTVGNDRGDTQAARLRVFMLLCMAGNIGLIVSADLVGFYVGFTTMGLASYGLIVHSGTVKAGFAARVYLVMTLLAEFALLAAFMLIYQRTGQLAPSSEQLVGSGDLELGLLFIAFAIKAGLLGFHVWLPLAHPAAPPAASAVLSGAMIKTALLGWITFMPLGEQALPAWGGLFIGLGSSGAIAAIAVGLTQSDPKVMLAYSSISKMNLLAAALGVALISPPIAEPLIGVIAAYAFFHGLNKGALFIGVGILKRYAAPWILALVAVPAAILSGIPFGAGATAKTALSEVLLVESSEAIWVLTLLTILAALTPLLMVRFLWCASSQSGQEAVDLRIVPWIVLIVLAAILPLGMFPALSSGSALLWSAAVVIALGGLYFGHKLFTARVSAIPPGDLIALLPRGSGFRWALSWNPEHTAMANVGQRLTRSVGRSRWPSIKGDAVLSISFPLLLLVLLSALLISP
ncbi:NADH/ubiquinone/plastoquinone (complex I) [Motiliproteus coralliicola]|uniref:NADH/ubiquinone/plastoquinone (Complex I) n=1 Tax=Motiliproteus coralliicola TaxID=2283196 RepID=A0A369WU25_9GAMM|nr:proton-conducting transporter membrane subunit [Motiliproteus coralliicola]RDE24064.1 NADH/ubiquinone/plastoquinone (complex I) [Motiliproteus coralliicola]